MVEMLAQDMVARIMLTFTTRPPELCVALASTSLLFAFPSLPPFCLRGQHYSLRIIRLLRFGKMASGFLISRRTRPSFLVGCCVPTLVQVDSQARLPLICWGPRR